MNLADNEPSLLRSTDSRRLSLVGIVDRRKAGTELTDSRPEAVRDCIQSLLSSARAAPRDEANQLSAGQRARIVQGPQESDVGLLTQKAGELLDFLRSETPKVMLRLGEAKHTLVRSHTLTSGGSEIETSVGHHSLTAFGVGREGTRVSSLQMAYGHCHEMAGHASAYFGIGEMLRSLERQLDARPVGDKFVGDVVLTPQAVADCIGWLLGQICDEPLIAGTSLYRDRVGHAVGSPLLNLRSRFDGPGIAAVSPDGFVAPPVEILREGVLQTLTPSRYASLKTGVPHVPIAAGGWEVAAGDTPYADVVAQSARGALVGRLSMGRPAANGDFAGVIKNSFAIVDGKVGHALSETMICGNVARMLLDVVAVSQERLDTGSLLLPWVRISGLHFS